MQVRSIMSSACAAARRQVLAHDAVALLRAPTRSPRAARTGGSRRPASATPIARDSGPISRMCSRSSAHTWWTFSAIAPESSSCPPGSSVTDAPSRRSAMIGAALVLALGRPAVLFRQLLEDADDAALALVRAPACAWRRGRSPFSTSGPDAPRRARLARLARTGRRGRPGGESARGRGARSSSRRRLGGRVRAPRLHGSMPRPRKRSAS